MDAKKAHELIEDLLREQAARRQPGGLLRPLGLAVGMGLATLGCQDTALPDPSQDLRRADFPSPRDLYGIYSVNDAYGIPSDEDMRADLRSDDLPAAADLYGIYSVNDAYGIPFDEAVPADLRPDDFPIATDLYGIGVDQARRDQGVDAGADAKVDSGLRDGSTDK